LTTAQQGSALTPLEIASGYLFGRSEHRPQLPTAEMEPRVAFEAAVRRALARPPAIVAFSGGRDSSGVLAVATAVARREGFPLPVPMTLRFPESAESDESSWQERLIAHLDLTDWIKIDITDELDSLGPYATRALLRHGVLWPPNAHFLMPFIESARDGSVLTGDGGDVTFVPSPWLEHIVDVLGRRVGPTPRDVLRFGLLVSPSTIRRRRLRRRYPQPVSAPWLRPSALAELVEAWARDAVAEPVALDTRAVWSWQSRSVQVAIASFNTLADPDGVQLVHPFNDPTFLSALARAARRFRYADRTQAMDILLSDVLPQDVRARSTKGGFRDVFWNRHAREFAAAWSGEGADPTLVDVDRLAQVWRSPEAREHFRSCTQLQASWLVKQAGTNGGASAGDRVEDAVDRVGH
jgi:hypothetical protein